MVENQSSLNGEHYLCAGILFLLTSFLLLIRVEHAMKRATECAVFFQACVLDIGEREDSG